MPGHSTPALIAYPEFDCPVPHRTWEWERWEYCVGNEKTYDFLQEMLSQAIALFPARYFHIGGDECPKGHWQKCPLCQAKMKEQKLRNEEELQSYFVKRIERFLNSRGRCLIGWDEILEGGIAPNAVVMAWRVDQHAATIAAQAGHDVVVAYTSHLYFDYSETTTPIEKVYDFEPVPQELTPEASSSYPGRAGPDVDRQSSDRTGDRAAGVSTGMRRVGSGVVSGHSRDYNSFTGRLAVHRERLAALGIHFSIPETIIR